MNKTYPYSFLDKESLANHLVNEYKWACYDCCWQWETFFRDDWSVQQHLVWAEIQCPFCEPLEKIGFQIKWPSFLSHDAITTHLKTQHRFEVVHCNHGKFRARGQFNTFCFEAKVDNRHFTGVFVKLLAVSAMLLLFPLACTPYSTNYYN